MLEVDKLLLLFCCIFFNVQKLLTSNFGFPTSIPFYFYRLVKCNNSGGDFWKIVVTWKLFCFMLHVKLQALTCLLCIHYIICTKTTPWTCNSGETIKKIDLKLSHNLLNVCSLKYFKTLTIEDWSWLCALLVPYHWSLNLVIRFICCHFIIANNNQWVFL
jgi:hypothetical protein